MTVATTTRPVEPLELEDDDEETTEVTAILDELRDGVEACRRSNEEVARKARALQDLARRSVPAPAEEDDKTS